MVKQIKRPSAFWDKLIAEFEARSDEMSLAAFCKHHGVPYSTFYRHRQRLLANATTTPVAQKSPFIEIELAKKPTPVDIGPIHIPMTLECGPFRLCIAELPDAAWLAELLVRTREAFQC